MIIYCAGPIEGDTTFQENYKEIIQIVETLGHTALAEFSSKLPTLILLSESQIYTRDIKWIDGSKLMIAEVSGPSLGVGFEISYALFERKIPVLAVYNDKVKNVSAMITGCNNPKLSVKKYYNADDLTRIIRNFIVNNGGN
jgi:2'-deoxynucleoside 5'-phosphate N-hydrolase